MRKAYQSDLSDAEWSCLQSHLPAPKANGRPRLHSPREILDAILYVLTQRLRLAAAAPRLPAVEDRLPLLPRLAPGRHLGEDARRPARAGQGASGAEPAAQRRHRRQPVGQDHRGGRASAATTAPRRSTAASATCSSTPWAWCSSPRFTGRTSPTATASSCSSNPRRSASSSAYRTCGWMPATPERKGRRMGGEGVGMDGRDRAPPQEAGSGGGDARVGEGAQQRGSPR